MKVILLICFLVSLAWGQKKGGGPCTQDVRKDPDDCTGFYRCVNSVSYWLKCAPGTVFNSDKTTCVHKGGPLDTCKPTEVNNPVSDGTSDRLIPHNESCALYYDREAPSRWRWEKNLQECPYPQVFNIENRKCEHYTMVDCGNRTLPLGKCEYKAHQCMMSHCMPCYVTTPSCRGSPNGLNPYPRRDGSPYFIVCVNQRLVYKGVCQSIGHQSYRYDEEFRTCVPRERDTEP